MSANQLCDCYRDTEPASVVVTIPSESSEREAFRLRKLAKRQKLPRMVPFQPVKTIAALTELGRTRRKRGTK